MTEWINGPRQQLFVKLEFEHLTFRYQHYEFSYIKDLAEPSKSLADSTGKKSKKKGDGNEEEEEKEVKDK